MVYKKHSWILLDGALKQEKEKLEKANVTPDFAEEYVNAKAWGYVITGYFLIEQSFKAILHVSGVDISPRGHSLSKLFNKLNEADKATLRKYYNDFKAVKTRDKYSNLGNFPFESLDDFLENLDGGKNNDEGSFVWRYYLIEENETIKRIPSFSAEYMHEIVSGCIKILVSLK